MEHSQNDSHDWFAECAENFVRYLFSAAGFEVFSAGKWAVDVAVRHRSTGQWWRVEVRSTERKKKPVPKSLRKLAGKAELVVEVVLISGQKLNTKFFFVGPDGRRSDRKLADPTPDELKLWLLSAG